MMHTAMHRPRRSSRRPGLIALAASCWLALGALPAQGTARYLPVALDADAAIRIGDRLTFGTTSEIFNRLEGPTGGYLTFLNEQMNPASVPEDPNVPIMIAQLQLPQNQGDSTSLIDLQNAVLVHAFASRRQLNEVMTHFWEVHFNTYWSSIRNYLIGQLGHTIGQAENIATWLEWQDNQFYRANALGKFRDLLEHTTKSPGMMMYLNLDGSKSCPNPNENYARELLELYSMGPDNETSATPNYTQTDLVEVAKCLTGWRVNNTAAGYVADYPLPNGNHCYGAKTIFRNLPHAKLIIDNDQQLEQVIDHVAGIEPTADFMCRKLMRWFLADAADDNHPAVLAAMKAAWGSDGDIEAVLRELFLSKPWFSKQYSRSRAVTPVELCVRTGRLWDGTLLAVSGAPVADKVRRLREAMFAIGQDLFNYPSPDGFSYESFDQPGSSVAIEAGRHVADIYRELIGPAQNQYGRFPTLDLRAIVMAALPPADHADPDKIATYMLGRLYGSRYTTTDHQTVRDALARDVGGALVPLDPNQPFPYAQRLAIGATVAANFVNGMLK